MAGYTITEGTAEQRRQVRDWLAGLDRVSPALAETMVTAWVSTWSASPYTTLAEMPYSTLAPEYRLMDHVNEVTQTGLDLMARAQSLWGIAIEPEAMLAILVLHDVDKPLMYDRSAGRVAGSALSRELPHGVVGAMLLKELGLPHRVVSTVATHAHNAPFHGSTPEAWVLHYADFFCTDHALRQGGLTPFYQRH
jgi:putative nucleotidyltransferase with HDIG domain